MQIKNEYDVIIVGSGTCGATIARELSRKKKKVLVLEQGADVPLRETMIGCALISQQVFVNKTIKALLAATTGGGTALYLAVCVLPSLNAFLRLGIDISNELEDTKNELPLAELPDELLSPQTKLLRQSMAELGYNVQKRLMLIDQSKCGAGYSYDAKWKAKNFVQEAVCKGATVINHAKANRALIDGNRVIGVEYKLRKGMAGSEICRAYGNNVVIATSFNIPKFFLDSGMNDFVKRDFFCKSAYSLYGVVPGLNGMNTFTGSIVVDDFNKDFILADSNLCSPLFKLAMLSELKMIRSFSYSNILSVGVQLEKVFVNGRVGDDGRFRLQLTEEEHKLRNKGEEIAVKMLKNAGAKNIFKSRYGVCGAPGGVIRIGENVDHTLQTRIKGLYVCDSSMFSEEMNEVTPTLTLVCLSKYLAKQILASHS